MDVSCDASALLGFLMKREVPRFLIFGGDPIVTYSINNDNGVLSQVNSFPSPIGTPTDLVVSKNGKVLYILNSAGDIAVLSLDADTGAIANLFSNNLGIWESLALFDQTTQNSEAALVAADTSLGNAVLLALDKTGNVTGSSATNLLTGAQRVATPVSGEFMNTFQVVGNDVVFHTVQVSGSVATLRGSVQTNVADFNTPRTLIRNSNRIFGTVTRLSAGVDLMSVSSDDITGTMEIQGDINFVGAGDQIAYAPMANAVLYPLNTGTLHTIPVQSDGSFGTMISTSIASPSYPTCATVTNLCFVGTVVAGQLFIDTVTVDSSGTSIVQQINTGQANAVPMAIIEQLMY